ncbi:hypothetical protein [Methanolacinia petrolearia]|uniref:hypothetical protein n=1 Tax=Methanolacinia petrolearia TaxID=54120 RepID=UPI003BAAE7FE
MVELDSDIYGDLYANGGLDFTNGDTYGEVHVDGDVSLTSGDVHDNIYVDGDLTLGWTPSIDEDAYIYYTGSLSLSLLRHGIRSLFLTNAFK